ncbi:AfsR/SARP family transcriptional regulator [Kitasatospora viridis]|uniref:DNA-binding SARP family transcriptional activator n=1 Tax=Kitasatospora viridis TaxID=281105 RepID=A0A561UJT5_9ACTN|nr:AfsR/SARP family transcriptional regulator [Kitasatospora viridis]TWF99630.1 DNA-binding SARP family transcriptional activator [Kitasatospora viridis]
MRYRILGPIQLGSHTPSAAKIRTVLAALLVRANEVAATGSLIDELWGEAPPRTATTTLQVYISQLRKACAAEDGEPELTGRQTRIATRSPGYLMRVEPDEFDLARFEALHADGRAAAERLDHREAARLLREALALWTGPALSGVPRGALLDAAVVRLEEQRLEALEQRIRAELALGRHRDLCGELMALVHEHPLHESLHAELMLALHRSGRQADALRTYDRIRRALGEELGVDPGAELRQLHERVLRFDPRLELPAAARPPEPAAAPAPLAGGGTPSPAPFVRARRLPPPVADFTGRQEQLGQAGQLLRAGLADPAGRVLAVVGAAGVGKTAFVVRLARELAGEFPDGCLFLGLRGPGGGALDPAQALLRLVRQLRPDAAESAAAEGGQPDGPADGPAVFEELADALHRALAGRRLLVVLDDAASEAQLRPVLPALTDCAVVLTARRTLGSLDGVRHLVLDVLTPRESLELLGATGGVRIAEDPAAAARIARLCGHLPLALRVAGASLAARPHWSAAALAARLEDERARLGVLACGDLDVRASLLVGYREAGAAERQAFPLLGLAAPEFPLWRAAALLGSPPAVAERVVERLVQAHLLQARATPGSPVRYRIHELHRAMALELLDRAGPESVRAATTRLCDAYLALSRHADARIAPGRALGPEPRPHRPDLLPDPAAEVRDAPLRWFQEEAPGLVALVRQAHTAGLWEQTWQLADSLVGYFQASAAWPDWETTGELALDAARRAGHPGAEAAALCSLGDLAWQRRQVTRALNRFELAGARARHAADARVEARSLIGLADGVLDRGDTAAARRAFGRALALCRDAEDARGTTDALRGIALAELLAGRSEEALRTLAECRRAAERLGDRRWTEFARRAAERIRAAAGEGATTADAHEVRPGVWLIG